MVVFTNWPKCTTIYGLGGFCFHFTHEPINRLLEIAGAMVQRYPAYYAYNVLGPMLRTDDITIGISYPVSCCDFRKTGMNVHYAL